MNFAYLLILVVMINAAFGTPDPWTRSTLAYIKIINGFLQQYYDAGKNSCQLLDPKNIVECAKIDENFEGSKDEIIEEADQILENIRKQFTVMPESNTTYSNAIIKGNADYKERVRNAVREYCSQVASNVVISRQFKGPNILLKHYLVVYVYGSDLGYDNNSENKFEKDCPGSKEKSSHDSHTPQTQGSFAGPSNYNNNVYQYYQ